MTDRFDVIGYDEHGHPKVRYCLDPREVTVIRDPERGDTVVGYVWEPVGPVPSPLRAEPMPPLTDEQYEELKGRFLAALHEPPVRLDDGIDGHSIDMEEQRGPRRRRWWRWPR